jgi:hypothetical protein
VGTLNVTIDIALTHEILLRACKQHLRSIVIEYCQLSVLDVLTDEQTVTLASILKQAETDPLLSFLLDEADHVIGHQLGLVDVKEIQTEQNGLRHLIDKTWMEWLFKKVQDSDTSLLSKHVLEQAQAQLKEHGLYTAEIDGVCGEKTKEAFQLLEKDFHQQVRISGLHSISGKYDQNISTKDAIELVNEKGIDEKMRKDAELLSLVTDPSTC